MKPTKAMIEVAADVIALDLGCGGLPPSGYKCTYKFGGHCECAKVAEKILSAALAASKRGGRQSRTALALGP